VSDDDPTSRRAQQRRAERRVMEPPSSVRSAKATVERASAKGTKTPCTGPSNYSLGVVGGDAGMSREELRRIEVACFALIVVCFIASGLVAFLYARWAFGT
jgi:hypothetical protein